MSPSLTKLEAQAEPLLSRLSELEALDTQALLETRALEFEDTLGYDPLEAQHLDRIQASSLALDTEELARLERDGFVISPRRELPTFGFGYTTLYAEHLPLYVSLDSVLEAVHRSFSDILAAIESQGLRTELRLLLQSLRNRLAERFEAGELDAEVAGDLDLYLSVAKSALTGQEAVPVAGASEREIGRFADLLERAAGEREVELFGVKRDTDFSQFEPRGHYTESEKLTRYFKAMMWLGRIDFRLIETLETGELVFRRRQFEVAALLGMLADEEALGHLETIDAVLRSFVGEPDYLQIPGLMQLLAELQVDEPADLKDLEDEAIAQAIVDGGYGAQRIASHLIINFTDDSLPLNRSFALLGQRYVLDSHVLANVVYDRVLPESSEVPHRLMPDPLDVAYAALGNDQALPLLQSELETYRYAPQLESVRMLAEEHDHAFWTGTLYNTWLDALRQMSPAGGGPGQDDSGRPTTMRSEAWGRRLLSAQLASWAELRHDTVLYVKQSYTAGVACEFPDGYVDPYPEAWRALTRFARLGQALVAELDLGGATDTGDSAYDYFLQLEAIVSELADMAERELRGEPFTAEQLEFLNQAVTIDQGCGGDPVAVAGWYGRLHFDRERGVEVDPVVTDVHTQYTDEAGNVVGRVLHVGTGSRA